MQSAADPRDVVYAHVAFDSAGRPMLVMPESDERSVLTGLDAKRVILRLFKFVVVKFTL